MNPSEGFAKFLNRAGADAARLDALGVLSLHRHFSVSGLSSSSANNYNLMGTGPRTFLVAPQTGETALVIRSVEVYMDAPGAWAVTTFGDATALNTGIRLAHFSGENAQRDFMYGFSPAGGFVIDNRRFMTACDDFVFTADTALTVGRTLKANYDFKTKRSPIYLSAGESLRLLLPAGDTIASSVNLLAIAKGQIVI